MSGPRQPLLRVEHLDDRRGAAGGDDEIGANAFVRCLRHQEAAERFRIGDRRRQADDPDVGRHAKQPREPERQQIAALGGDQRMQFVEHDALQRLEQERRIGRGQQQRHLLRRRQQDVRRITALPLPPRHRRIAGPRLDLHRQLHLGDRPFEIAGDVDGQRLERRDVERVQAGTVSAMRYLLPSRPAERSEWRGGVGGGGQLSLEIERRLIFGCCLVFAPEAPTLAETPPTPDPSPPPGFAALRRAGGRGEDRCALGELHQRRQEPGQGLAGAGRRDQQGRASGLRLFQQGKLMLARRPAARFEPAAEAFGKQCSMG